MMIVVILPKISTPVFDSLNIIMYEIVSSGGLKTVCNEGRIVYEATHIVRQEKQLISTTTIVNLHTAHYWTLVKTM